MFSRMHIWNDIFLPLLQNILFIKFYHFSQVYRRERLFPLLRSLAIQYKQPEIYALGPFQETDVQISPKGIPEMVILQRQASSIHYPRHNYVSSVAIPSSTIMNRKHSNFSFCGGSEYVANSS